MSIAGIIYTSNTGYTAEYAKILGEKTGLVVYDAAEAHNALPMGAEVVYMSWLMAGRIVDYKKIAERYSVAALCAVGLSAAAGQDEMIRKNNGVPQNTPLFLLPGGYNSAKLRGMYKWIMKIVTKVMIQKINALEEQTDTDKAMLEVLKNGGSFVREENLEGILKHLSENDV